MAKAQGKTNWTDKIAMKGDLRVREVLVDEWQNKMGYWFKLTLASYPADLANGTTVKLREKTTLAIDSIGELISVNLSAGGVFTTIAGKLTGKFSVPTRSAVAGVPGAGQGAQVKAVVSLGAVITL